MRFAYTIAMYLATPLLLLRLFTRGIRFGGAPQRWSERFGIFVPPARSGGIWIHAVSVGEVNAAVPLIKALQNAHPDIPLIVTTVTQTGSARVQQTLGNSVFHVYLPYDLPFAVRGFLRRVQPRLALIVETEIWPNLYFGCRDRSIPLMIVNARLSRRSLRGYRTMRSLVRAAIRCASLIAAQSAADAMRYRELGASGDQLIVSGNLKYDMLVPAQWREEGRAFRMQWGERRPVWIAASTHEGEELAVLKAHLETLNRLPDALLLIAPRHPERFRLVEHSVRSLGFSVAARTADHLPHSNHQVFLIDSMGELMPFFAASDVAFVGGSFVPIGGHNVLEPAALSVPVLVGPQTFNFEEITLILIESQAAERVTAPDRLGSAVLQLLLDPALRQRMGEHAQAVFDSERGAVKRVMVHIEQLLNGTGTRH